MIEATMTAPTTLVLRHTIDATQERVYAAWTTPEIMRSFIAPEGVGVGKIAADARVGGAYSIEMIHADGEAPWVVGGTYTEMHPYDRIAFTWSWTEDDATAEHETLVTLDLTPNGEKTDIVLTHSRFKDETSRNNHTKGWTSILGNLGAVARTLS